MDIHMKGSSTIGGGQMQSSGVYFDPQTLELLRRILDDAWHSLPSDHELRKSEMAARMLKRAAEGERDPARLRAAAIIHPL
jgi:hypothetical protein